MKRILHIVSCMELGGTEAFIMNNYRTIDRTEYQFDFLIFHKKDYPYLKEIEQLGGNIYYAIPPKAENAMKLIKIIVKTIRENGPYDAVHSHVNDDNVWGMIAAKMAGVPVRISHSHNMASLRKSQW